MSEITHVICARCGADNILSNDSVLYGISTEARPQVLKVIHGCLMFNCTTCNCLYKLPVAFEEPT